MTEAGSIVIKFWLAIDTDEQERRFKAREEPGYKRYKITDEDWRNSTSMAPWVLVETNDKYHARIKVLKTVCEQIEKSL